MSGRNVPKFRLQFSGLSVNIFLKKMKTDIELLKETENFNTLVLHLLFREEVDLTSTH